jgi:hypothetical protein
MRARVPALDCTEQFTPRTRRREHRVILALKEKSGAPQRQIKPAMGAFGQVADLACENRQPGYRQP